MVQTKSPDGRPCPGIAHVRSLFWLYPMNLATMDHGSVKKVVILINLGSIVLIGNICYCFFSKPVDPHYTRLSYTVLSPCQRVNGCRRGHHRHWCDLKRKLYSPPLDAAIG